MNKPREYVTDEGVAVYCSDIEKGTYCPYTKQFVNILDACYTCKNKHSIADFALFCLRFSGEKANE